MKTLLPKTNNRRKIRETVLKVVLERSPGDPYWWVSFHRGRIGRPSKLPTLTPHLAAAREFALLYTTELLVRARAQSPEPRAQSPELSLF